MTSISLGASYLTKAATRLNVLDMLLRERAYSDVVREAQEAVELALNGVLRVLGVESPKIHDVDPFLLEYRNRLPIAIQPDADRMAEASRWLRKEREFSFYGEVDLIPTESTGSTTQNGHWLLPASWWAAPVPCSPRFAEKTIHRSQAYRKDVPERATMS